MADPSDTAERFVDALRARDLDAACALVSDDVELVGWRGDEQGAETVRAWLTRLATAIQPLRWRHAGDEHVLEHLGTTLPADPEYGRPHVALRGELALTVRDGRVVRIDPDPAHHA